MTTQSEKLAIIPMHELILSGSNPTAQGLIANIC